MVFSLGPGHGLPVRLPQWGVIRAEGPDLLRSRSAQAGPRGAWSAT